MLYFTYKIFYAYMHLFCIYLLICLSVTTLISLFTSAPHPLLPPLNTPPLLILTQPYPVTSRVIHPSAVCTPTPSFLTRYYPNKLNPPAPLTPGELKSTEFKNYSSKLNPPPPTGLYA